MSSGKGKRNAIICYETKAVQITNSNFDGLKLTLSSSGTTGSYKGINFRYYQTVGFIIPQTLKTNSFILTHKER